MLPLPKTQRSQAIKRIMDVSGVLYHRVRALCRPGLAILVLLILAIAVFPQTQHSIKVSWTYTQGTDPATGFNVYRATVSGGPYTKQTTTPLPLATLSYTDTSGTGGVTYYYVVTAVDSTGSESAYSTQVSATFLANPAVPQGVTAVAQ